MVVGDEWAVEVGADAVVAPDRDYQCEGSLVMRVITTSGLRPP